VPIDGVELESRERELFGFSHPDISAEVTAHWNLSLATQAAVQMHESQLEPRDGSQFRLGDVVQAADRYVEASGFSVMGHHYGDEATQQALDPLGIAEGDISSDFLQQFSLLATVS
jgi:hypothetical protein